MSMMLRSLRLPAIQREYGNLAKRAESNTWSFEHYLKVLLELEISERSERRIERLLKRSGLPEGKNLTTLDQKLMPVKIRRQIPSLVEGGFVEVLGNVVTVLTNRAVPAAELNEATAREELDAALADLQNAQGNLGGSCQGQGQRQESGSQL
jgi:hypothetical protein